MLAPGPMVVICFVFRDRNGNEGRTYAYLPFVSSDATVHSFVAFYMPYLQALSNAKIVGWDATWSAKDFTPQIPSSESNVSQNLTILYRDGELFDWILLPSPRIDLYEISGDYEGIRLDAMRPDVIDILEDWQAVVEFVVNSRGDSFPVEFAAAGLAK